MKDCGGRSEIRPHALSEWDVAAAQMAKRHGFSARTDYHGDYEKEAVATRLAREILRLSRNTLLIHLRFLEAALVRLPPLPEGARLRDETLTGDLATDGRFLYYNSLHVCRSFKMAPEIPARDLLHVTLHCVFQHLFVGKKVNRDLWDLACDVAVESVINELDLKSLRCGRQEKQGWLVEKFKREHEATPQRPGGASAGSRPTAERLYRWLLDQQLPPQEISRIRAYFYADDHKIWYNDPVRAGGGGQGNESGGDSGDRQDALAPAERQDVASFPPADAEDDQNASGGRDTGERRAKEESGGEGLPTSDEREKGDKHAMTPEETRQMWKEISERIQVDLETSSASWGEQAGGFVAALAEVNRERVDYAAFLRRFAVLGENIQVNDDEFDAIYYTYGMKLNRNMPLIEPLEYKEVKKVREFIIALDTSESVAGGLVQAFVNKTWNILKQTDNFFSRVNVHILQCGAKVEEDAKITSQDEFDEYMRRMTLRGFGGTDFRPVFEHVDRLIACHELMNLRGLIYFTDGYGTFPAMPPQYETAFVFIKEDRDPPEVPVWAVKILMTPDEIEELSDTHSGTGGTRDV